MIPFQDDDQFGDMTFLDILEDASIPFVYDGKHLHFLHNASQAYATNLWNALTGKTQIGAWK